MYQKLFDELFQTQVNLARQSTASVQPGTSLINTILGNYRLLQLLGEGGFADVYLGQHRYLNSYAAIRVMQERVTGQNIRNFIQEAQTIAHLRHPHIIRLLDFGVEETKAYLAMDYAPGGTLRQRHPEGTIVSLATILHYVQQVASALQYAHDHKLVHRDIKPANMLVDAGDAIVLSDFGIAVAAHSTQSISTQEVVGTVSYMAPEQINGKPRPASDQYALAVVVYEWLCGACPFGGNTVIEIAMLHISAPPPPLRARIPTIPPAVERVVLRALAKAPSQRFDSVQALACALEYACNYLSP